MRSAKADNTLALRIWLTGVNLAPHSLRIRLIENVGQKPFSFFAMAVSEP